MLLFPQVQKKAQEELDEVVGSDRLPTFEDKDALVYVTATVMEALRWHLVTPLGVPHCTVIDDEFHGYLIPAGTTVIYNSWYVSIILNYIRGLTKLLDTL